MNDLISYSVRHARSIISIFILLLIAGTATFINIPKESNPDIPIPNFYVSINHEGISPEDAERLLLRPMERQLKSLDGLKQISATASEGHASISLKFVAGLKSEEVMADVRDAVTLARDKLPSDTEEPTINEVTMARESPAVTVMLYGDVPERTLYTVARGLRDQLEGFSEVIEVKLNGDREDVLEVLIDPGLMESYDISLQEIFSLVNNNNRLVAAGTLDTGAGMFAVKVPGIVQAVGDIYNLPMKVNGDKVVTFGDVAQIRQSFKDATSFVRLNGKPAVSLEVIKQPGQNTIETVKKVKALVNEFLPRLPGGIEVAFTGDTSKDIKEMLTDLTNNVLSAVLLVAIIILAFLGVRSALLVGFAIPGSFLSGILILSFFGVTINIVVLFALIMSVGLLVDGAIVITEYADRRMSEGIPKRKAYIEAAQRMAWPILASTATTLVVFMPLLFWPGEMGEFMKYLPMTLIAVLSASLVMALIFVPTLGSIFGKSRFVSEQERKNLIEAEDGDLSKITGLTAVYLKFLSGALRWPGTVVLGTVVALLMSYISFYLFGLGSQYFPEIEPPFTSIKVKARGDLSIVEKDHIVSQVEAMVLDTEGVESVFTKTTVAQGSDTIGTIRLNFMNWDERVPASVIIDQIRSKLETLPGVVAQIEKFNAGPSQGKPLQIQLLSHHSDVLEQASERLEALLEAVGGFTDIENTRPLPGIEWRLSVDREKAAQFGADVNQVGLVVPLVTTGIKVAEYRPDGVDDEVDIRVRFNAESRHLDQLDRLRIKTERGMVPISNFVVREPGQKTDVVNRADGMRSISVMADLAPGVLLNNQMVVLQQKLEETDLDPRVHIKMRGENEEQAETMVFLMKALAVALFIMAIILVTQFNSFYQAFLILTAVIFSTAGVFLGLLIMNKPFGIVMSGIGVISLAGIIVNNNIVLIDTFNVLRRKGFPLVDAVLRTGAQRLRPVLLTTVTTIIGLLPMVLQVNIDILTREVAVGAPSTQWWTQLASAIAGGLTFATFLTLVVTPVLLLIGGKMHARLRAGRDGVPADDGYKRVTQL